MTTAPVEDRLLVWAVAASAIPGESCSGDQHVVHRRPTGMLIAVVDGLGHGPEAEAAALVALDTLAAPGPGDLPTLFDRCHRAMQGTRGAAMTLATVTRSGLLEWFGVGNVEAVLCPADPRRPREHVPLRGGIVGYGQLPGIRPSTVQLAPDDVLAFATDGIRSDFAGSLTQLLADADPKNATPGVVAARIHADNARGTDDALVLVARYVGVSS